MKSIAITILAIITVFDLNLTRNEIDYNPRLLQKELIGLKCSDNFKISEIKLIQSLVPDNDVNGKFFSITCNNSFFYSAYIGRVTSCRRGGCSNLTESSNLTDYEYFDYFILYDREKRIISVRIFNYEATHGHEIMVKGWLKQFVGYDGSGTLRAGKEVDSISGATISVNSLVEDICAKTRIIGYLNMSVNDQ